MAKNELTVLDNFNLQTLKGELAQAIEEELDGLGSLPFDRVKIPAGGGLAFDVPGENDENPESVTDITGVILDHHPVNSYWRDKFAGSNQAPDCSSMDGKTGVDRETGEIKECASCPYNQFGSDDKGKACKNVHRLYILKEGNPVPLVLSLPPTSLRYMRDYVGKRILLKGLRCWQCVTKITLKKEKNAAGIAYSRAVFTFVGTLPEQAQKDAEAMRECVKQQYRQTVTVDGSDYNTDGAPASDDGFMNVPNAIDDGELPF